MRVTIATAVMIGLMSAVPANAADPTTNTAAGKKAPKDVNEVVCERQEVVGSRLATRKVCMTRGQWADLKSQDRQDIEKVQINRPMDGS